MNTTNDELINEIVSHINADFARRDVNIYLLATRRISLSDTGKYINHSYSAYLNDCLRLYHAIEITRSVRTSVFDFKLHRNAINQKINLIRDADEQERLHSLIEQREIALRAKNETIFDEILADVNTKLEIDTNARREVLVAFMAARKLAREAEMAAESAERIATQRRERERETKLARLCAEEENEEELHFLREELEMLAYEVPKRLREEKVQEMWAYAQSKNKRLKSLKHFKRTLTNADMYIPPHLFYEDEQVSAINSRIHEILGG